MHSMNSRVGSIAARDGGLLRTRRWAPEGDAWARLLLVHGIAEHSGRYERTGALLAAGGVDVWAFDLRGFGGSAGRRAFVRRWDDYLDDVGDRLVDLRNALPVVLMGHSMGGLIALTYATSERTAPDLLVLSSPALGTTVPALVRSIAPLLSRVLPTLAIGNALRGEQLATDPDVGRAYFLDPLSRATVNGAPRRRAVRRSSAGTPRPLPAALADPRYARGCRHHCPAGQH